MNAGEGNFLGWWSAKSLKYEPYSVSSGSGFAMQSISPMHSFIVGTTHTGVNFPGWYLPDRTDANVGWELIIKNNVTWGGWIRLDSDSSGTQNIIIKGSDGGYCTDHVKFYQGGSVTLRLIKDGSGNFWWLLLRSFQPPMLS